MKKKNDPYAKSGMSMMDIGSSLVTDMTVRDARFEYFWNYKPINKLVMGEDAWFRSKKKTKILIGGNKSSKTTHAIYEAIMIYTGIIPPPMKGIYPHVIPVNRPRRVRIIVYNFTEHFPMTILPLLIGDPDMGAEGMLPEAWSKYDPQQHIFYGPDGSMMSIIAIDPSERVDPRILRGPLIDHTVIDEINQECIIDESLTRLTKDGPNTVTNCYCPQEGTECWTYNRFYVPNFDPVSEKKRPMAEQHPHYETEVLSMRDNPSVTEEQIQVMIQSVKPWEVPFRVWGKYSNTASNPYFDIESCLAWDREGRCEEGRKIEIIPNDIDKDTGHFNGFMKTTELHNPNKYGIWKMWGGPKQGHKYVLATDTAEGNERGDFSVADVWDFTDSERPYQIAQLRTRALKPNDFAIQCACMATVFGSCLIIVEAKGYSGGAFVETVRNYKNLYHRTSRSRDRITETQTIGWDTNVHTKGPLLDNLYNSLRECLSVRIPSTNSSDKKRYTDYCPLKSRATLVELISYEERIEKNRDGSKKIILGAARGGHDDTVIAMAMAFWILKVETNKITSCNFKKNSVVNSLTELEKQAEIDEKGKRSFSNIKKKPNIVSLNQRRSLRNGIKKSSVH